MPELAELTFDIWALVGLAGGGVFFASWLLQAWETRQAGQPVVSWRFFGMRLFGSTVLLLESIRVGSPGLIVVNLGTAMMMSYNLYMILRRSPAEPPPAG